MNKNKILVTGGLGYIGSHTVVELIEEGYDVVIIDNLSNSRIEILDRIYTITKVKPTFYPVDLTESDKLDHIFKTEKFDAVIHFAAYLLVDESVDKPLTYYRNNLFSLLNVVHYMSKYSVKNLVFSSSCTVYGNPSVLPVDENSPIQESPSPYGNTKIMGEKILRDTCELEGKINTISLRYFNPVGAHKSALIGEIPKNKPSHLFPIISKVVCKELNSFKVFGNDYNTEDGTAIRDYIHVTDLAKAHISALSRLILGNNEKKYEYYNIGSGNGYSVLEIIKQFENIANQKLGYEIVARREGDVAKIWASIENANLKLGWYPQKKLSDMVISSIEWEKHILNNPFN